MRRIRAVAAAAMISCVVPAWAGELRPLDNQDQWVKQVDWKAMQTVEIVLTEHEYTPDEVRLTAGKPYRIRLKNTGNKAHYFVAPEFFRAVAWRKLMVPDQAEIKVDDVNALEVLKQTGVLDLYIVPVKKGEYEAWCSIKDHREKGMEGVIVIE